MSFSRSFTSALYRSIDAAKQSLSMAVRMDVTPRTSQAHGRLPFYALTTPDDLQAMAKGSDGDLGGKSTMKLELDGREQKGRFYGTLSNEVPTGAKLERSGYAGIRNRNRPTLFGAQTWDTTVYPLLRLRVRNRLAPRASGAAPAPPTSLRSILSSSSLQSASPEVRAKDALGYHLTNRPGPKFFVNIQTDGPVTSDLFQHRLVLDENVGDAWQDVIIPLSNFVLINAGVVAGSQMSMMREKVRTIGISAVLEIPSIADLEHKQKPKSGPPDALQSDFTAPAAEETQTVRGSRRAATFNFDLGIERIEAITEDALKEEREEAVYGKRESL